MLSLPHDPEACFQINGCQPEDSNLCRQLADLKVGQNMRYTDPNNN